jgi:hypothetical protein
VIFLFFLRDTKDFEIHFTKNVCVCVYVCVLMDHRIDIGIAATRERKSSF